MPRLNLENRNQALGMIFCGQSFRQIANCLCFYFNNYPITPKILKLWHFERPGTRWTPKIDRNNTEEGWAQDWTTVDWKHVLFSDECRFLLKTTRQGKKFTEKEVLVSPSATPRRLKDGGQKV